VIPLLLAALAPNPPPYPAEQVLAAFGEACRGLDDFEQMEANAQASGWARFVPDPASPIGELIATGRSAAKKMLEKEGGGSMSPVRVLRRQVAGEDLVAILSGVHIGGTKVNGCRIYDVGEARQIPAVQAERWMGRAPSRTADDPAISIARWEPGYAARHDSFEIYFVPANSPAVNVVKFSGVVLTASLVGAKK
jgi:hypothetical protein